MRKALVRKGFAFAILMAFVLAMWFTADVCKATAAEKMDRWDYKLIGGAGWGLARMLAAPILVVKEGLNFEKNGVFAPVKGVFAGVVDEATNIPRTGATMGTALANAENYNTPVGQFSPEAQKVADSVPNLGAPY